jgi:potassium-transporting ATPase KdpC subunit
VSARADTIDPTTDDPERGDSLLSVIRPALMVLVVLTLLTGLIYPLVITGVSQAIFKDKANGSLIARDGQTIGSALIGQNFFGADGYFWGRPSAAGADGYDANASGGSNLGPTNPELVERINQTVAAIRAAHPERGDTPIPVDLVTASASGLDPQISPAAAEYQVLRVARQRRLSVEQVRQLVKDATEGRSLGVLGEAGINVLKLNLALDRAAPLAADAP